MKKKSKLRGESVAKSCISIISILSICFCCLFMVGCFPRFVKAKRTKKLQQCFFIKSDERVFDKNEPIVLDFYFGTDVARDNYKGNESQELVMQVYSYEKDAINSIGSTWSSLDKEVLFTIDDFCSETYPAYNITENGEEIQSDNPHKTITVSRELFKYDKGVVAFGCEKFGRTAISILGYEKSGDNIRVIDLNRNECFS